MIVSTGILKQILRLKIIFYGALGQIFFIWFKSSAGKSFLPSERQRIVHHGWIKKHAGSVSN